MLKYSHILMYPHPIEKKLVGLPTKCESYDKIHDGFWKSHP